MYLSRSISDKNGIAVPMAGVLPFGTKWSDKLKISFLKTKAGNNTLLSRKNQIHKGHEFHMFDIDTKTKNYAWDVLTHAGRTEGYANDYILASFIHRHFWSDPQMAYNLLSV